MLVNRAIEYHSTFYPPFLKLGPNVFSAVSDLRVRHIVLESNSRGNLKCIIYQSFIRVAVGEHFPSFLQLR
jgi:hypothetical protein